MYFSISSTTESWDNSGDTTFYFPYDPYDFDAEEQLLYWHRKLLDALERLQWEFNKKAFEIKIIGILKRYILYNRIKRHLDKRLRHLFTLREKRRMK